MLDAVVVLEALGQRAQQAVARDAAAVQRHARDAGLGRDALERRLAPAPALDRAVRAFEQTLIDHRHCYISVTMAIRLCAGASGGDGLARRARRAQLVVRGVEPARALRGRAR